MTTAELDREEYLESTEGDKLELALPAEAAGGPSLRAFLLVLHWRVPEEEHRHQKRQRSAAIHSLHHPHSRQHEITKCTYGLGNSLAREEGST